MTDESKTLFPLAKALLVANQTVRELEDVCERSMICGSIRRQCQHVHDVDIVVIPAWGGKDLFGKPTRNLVADRVGDMAADGRIRIEKAGERIIRFTPLRGVLCPVDIYLSDELRWWTDVFIRTGSANHNILMCSAAQRMGYTLHADGRGIRDPEDQLIPVTSEEQVFEILDVPWREPEERR